MKRSTLLLTCLCLLLTGSIYAQNNNGQLDMAEEFSTPITVPFEMPDGTTLMTDVYLPITRDCLMVSLDIPLVGNQTLELIPKGTQLIVYDSLNGDVNPNPYQLPMVLTRTPYNKGDGDDLAGTLFSILGYAYAFQDMRGRYSSEGVYMPMYSDSWNKNPYHPDFGHVLDVTDLSDPKNGNKHEDGYHTIEFIRNNLTREYDLDRDGIPETTDLIYNGTLGMFGASALGNTQYQAAAAHRIDPNQPGLKCLVPIVATNEHYRFTGYQNGVFRDRIVTGWIRGQIFDVEDEFIDMDDDIHNDLHTSSDYGLPNKFMAANMAIDHFSTVQYGGVAGYYPNSRGRADMDASAAPVNEQGEGDANGQYSRYSNMEVPAFHITGWWDIFTDGQIETWDLMRKNLDPALGNNRMQKLIIGPWAHQTIGSRETGDMKDDFKYPENVIDILGIDLGGLNEDDIDVGRVLGSELMSWYRFNLNADENVNVGEPKALLPESNVWQDLGGLASIRVPAEDFYINYDELINFISGQEGLPSIPVEVEIFGSNQSFDVDVPALGEALLPELSGTDEPVRPPRLLDYNEIPDVRFYLVGPVNDGIPENANVGNYWMGAEEFPLTQDIQWTDMYLHQDGSITDNAPTTDEGYSIYVHDPDDPVLTTGGANMIVRTPQDDRDSQGQMNLADPDFAPYSMDRPGVVHYTTDEFVEPYTIIGYPEVKLYAKSNPDGLASGPTDTDFFVRILDVYPDGREMFVVEGAVNARAREYARSIVMGEEDRNAPFSNIEAGQIYEYYFSLMPIGYVWGKGHRMKVLISSSNYTRYQVNPNLPIQEGEFFRRKPGDGQGYTYNGTFMLPRVAVQRIHFSPDHPTKLRLPVYRGTITDLESDLEGTTASLGLVAYPNPATDVLSIFVKEKGQFDLTLRNALGQAVMQSSFVEETSLEVSHLPKGVYFVTVTSTISDQSFSQKVIIK